MIGIYKITNLINGKSYIGQSVNIKKRWQVHCCVARTNSSNAPIHCALRKYGKNSFIFEILEECDQSKLDEKEIYWINYYNTLCPNGYNILCGGNQGGVAYDYNEIYELWQQGYLAKEIEKIIGCGDVVITSALRAFHISEHEVKSRSQSKVKKYVALDPFTKEPLKIFRGQNSISLFFKKYGYEDYEKSGCINYALDTGNRQYGYYWQVLNENNCPKIEISDEEFLKKKKEQKKYFSPEEKEKLSLRMRTVERPTRDELKKLIRTTPFTTIGKIYSVSDNAIKKWCDRYGLPRKKNEIVSYSDEEWELI